MFTAKHFLWLGLCFVFILVMSFVSCKKSFSLHCAGEIMTIISVLSEGSKIMSNMVESPKGGMHLDPLALPFHLCSLMLFVVLYITFGADGQIKQLLIDFIAVAGTLGSLCALLIPTNGTDFASLRAYQCFVYHAGLLWFSLYLILAKYAKLGKRALRRNLVLLLALAIGALYANSVLSAYDTNFLYLTRPPMKNLPFLNLNHGWYIYFLRISCLGIGLVTLFHLPFILRERQEKKRMQTAR